MRFDAQFVGETLANDLRFRQVFFRNRDNFGPFAQFGVELFEFVANRLVVRDRVGSVDRRRLDVASGAVFLKWSLATRRKRRGLANYLLF